MTDREKHISVLQNIDRAYRTFTQEEYRALEYAIASLKTDLKYDLMYEGEEVYTKANLVAMLTEIQLEIEELDSNHTMPDVWSNQASKEIWNTALKLIEEIIEVRINNLKGMTKDGEESG